MKYSPFLKESKNLSPIEAMNIVLERYSVEKSTDLPIRELRLFERCIKKRKIIYQYPFQDCPIPKLYVPTLIKSVSHAFLVSGQYTVREFMRDDKVVKITRNDFDLYDEEFNEFWYKCSKSVRDYVEKCAQFYVDSFYAYCIKEIPFPALYAKWVTINKAELYFNNTLNEYYLRLL